MCGVVKCRRCTSRGQGQRARTGERGVFFLPILPIHRYALTLPLLRLVWVELPYRSLSLWLSFCSSTSIVRHYSRHVTCATASCALARTLASLVSACAQAHLHNCPADHRRPRQPRHSSSLAFRLLHSLPACLPARVQSPIQEFHLPFCRLPCNDAYARSGRRVRGGMTCCSKQFAAG